MKRAGLLWRFGGEDSEIQMAGESVSTCRSERGDILNPVMPGGARKKGLRVRQEGVRCGEREKVKEREGHI